MCEQGEESAARRGRHPDPSGIQYRSQGGESLVEVPGPQVLLRSLPLELDGLGRTFDHEGGEQVRGFFATAGFDQGLGKATPDRSGVAAGGKQALGQSEEHDRTFEGEGSAGLLRGEERVLASTFEVARAAKVFAEQLRIRLAAPLQGQSEAQMAFTDRPRGELLDDRLADPVVVRLDRGVIPSPSGSNEVRRAQGGEYVLIIGAQIRSTPGHRTRDGVPGDRHRLQQEPRRGSEGGKSPADHIFEA